MIVLLVLLFIVIGVFGYLFFAPLYMEINTTKGLYRIRLHWLASISIKPVEDIHVIEMKLAGVTKQINPFAMQISPVQNAVPKKEKKQKKYASIPWKKMKRVLNSFTIKKCRIRFDSGDVQMNGLLYPLFYWIRSYSGKDVRINFTGENEVILEIKNSLARMSWTYISS